MSQIYTQVDKIADADAVCVTYLNDKEPPKHLPFKFPAIKDDEVLIQLQYTGLCQTDPLAATNKWGNATYPLVPGHEIAGKITKIGAKVSDHKIGDYVGAYFQRNFCETCEFCLKGEIQLCRMPGNEKYIFNPYFGGFATHVQVPGKCAIPIPEKLKPEHACSLMCAGITVFSPLLKHGKAGMKCAVIGIGGLGHLAVQYAAKMGMEVTAFSASPSKVELCKKLGATHVVNSTDLKEIQAHTKKFDIVIQTLYGTDDQKVYTAMSALTNVHGKYVVVGLPHVGFQTTFDQFHIVTKETHLVGSLIGAPQVVKKMLEFSAEHDVVPMVEIFKFEDFNAAIDKLENGRPLFRCVVDCESYSKANGLAK